MKYGYRWKPSKTAAQEFVKKMDEVERFCNEHGISHSASMDSFYFNINGESYRVSNHTVAASNAGRFGENPVTGEWVERRERYHTEGEFDRNHEITASKTRIIDIYNDLAAGIKLDKRGKRIEESPSIGGAADAVMNAVEETSLSNYADI